MISAGEQDFSDLRVLLVEDDEIMRVSIEDRLRLEGLTALAVADLAAARRQLDGGQIDLVVSDIRLPDGSGKDLFEHAHRHHPGLPVILMTGFGSIADAVSLVRAGATDYLEKPFDMEEFVRRIRRTLAQVADSRLAGELAEAQGMALRPGLLGRDPAIRRIERLIARLRDVDSPVLIAGEGGTGKTLLANLIHYNSRRATKPLVRVDCRSQPGLETALALFGGGGRESALVRAKDGTLVLDELTDLSPEEQGRVARLLGPDADVSRAVRLVATTRADPAKALDEGRFHSDLYWRFNVIRIDLPPLRQRPKDIVHLAHLFLKECADAANKRINEIAPEAEARLVALPLPGNVRELRNLIERAVAFCDGSRIEEHDLSLDPDDEIQGDGDRVSLRDAVEDAERAAIQAALIKHHWSIQKAADALGISRKNLWEKMRRYRIAR